jgi:hypothetical protein
MDGSSGVNNFIAGNPGNILVNYDNDISGTGTIFGELFTNYGTVETNNSFGAGTLTIWGGYSSGVGFDNVGSMDVDAGGTMVLGASDSQITNNSLIQFLGTSGNAATMKIIAGSLTISGSGFIDMLGSDPAEDYIVSNGSTATLTLLGQTLQGGGNVGDTNLILNIGSGSLVNADNGEFVFYTGSNTIYNASGAKMEATAGGILDIFSDLTNAGTVTVSGAVTNMGGSVSIGTGGTLFLFAAGSITGNVKFAGDDATLHLNAGVSQVSGHLVGATYGDDIEMVFQPFAAGDHCVWVQASGNGVLLLENSGGTILQTFTLNGQYASGNFTAVSDGSIGTLIELAVNAYDFNGDSNEDILLQNGSGNTVYADMAGGSFNGFVSVANTPGYSVVGSGKISGSADADVVLENASGQILYANMVNGTFGGFASVATTPGFSVVGVGDINHDGYADVVVEDIATGQTLYANMNGGVFNNWANVATTPGYTVDAVADINDDGFADVVIENASGTILYANMDNGVFSGFASIANASGFTVMGAGDIARTGDADVVVENQSTGQILYANMVNGAFGGWVKVATTPGWTVSAVEDVMGNGYDDIVIENQSTGQLLYANMTGGTFGGWVTIGSVPGFTAHTDPGPVPVTASDPGTGSVTGLTMSDPGSAGVTPVSMFDPGPANPSTAVTPANAGVTNVLHAGAAG